MKTKKIFNKIFKLNIEKYNLKKLIKAVSKHALMCPGFKKELNKDFLCF